jgi:hypothetical protein
VDAEGAIAGDDFVAVIGYPIFNVGILKNMETWRNFYVFDGAGAD